MRKRSPCSLSSFQRMHRLAGFGAVATAIACTTLVIACSGDGAKTMIQRDRAVELAKTEATRLGYSIETMEISADETNSRWVEFVRPTDLPRQYPDLAPKLAARRYWAVWLKPRQKPGHIVLGGDIFVFVDATNGEILGVLRGK